MKKFRMVVALDTIIFYPEHEELLKKLVDKPKIERVPLVYNYKRKEWLLPENYYLPKDANIIIWPSSLPQSFKDLSIETHSKLNTAQCWTEVGLNKNISDQNLYNRVKDADCILTCWTEIPDSVLDNLIRGGKLKAIFTWTHEFEHRLNVKKAKEAGIYTDCVPDYGTCSVAELVINSFIELIHRNKKNNDVAKTEEDIAIAVLKNLFDHYKKSLSNEKKTRNGQFAHQFHKMGRALEHYSSFFEKELNEIIPEKSLKGKSIGFIGVKENNYFQDILKNSFDMRVNYIKNPSDSSEYYEFISENELIFYDSNNISKKEINKLELIKNEENIFDLASVKSYNENLKGKTLGIVGLGRIGTKVAEMASNMGLNVKYYSPNKKDKRYEKVSLEELFKTSDVISVNVSAHKAKGLIDEKLINYMKKGSYFINTSDGNSVDQKSLTKKMLNNEIYVALDVYKGLPTTDVLCLPVSSKKIKKLLSEHFFTYRAGWKTQESVRVKTYKLIGHMVDCLYK